MFTLSDTHNAPNNFIKYNFPVSCRFILMFYQFNFQWISSKFSSCTIHHIFFRFLDEKLKFVIMLYMWKQMMSAFIERGSIAAKHIRGKWVAIDTFIKVQRVLLQASKLGSEFWAFRKYWIFVSNVCASEQYEEWQRLCVCVCVYIKKYMNK